jgi:hypothetical protein
MFSKRAAFTTTVLAVAMGTAACDTEQEETRFYCADEQGQIVDENFCDDPNSTGGYFIWYGSSSHYSGRYTPGTKLPPGGQKISINDSAGRSRLGLPSSGKIANGSTKTGVVGKGGSGSGAKSGS